MTDYQFTSDWFSRHTQVWEAVFRLHCPNPTKILEVGSYEGRSAVWLIENALKAGGELHCVDHWRGGWEHEGEDMDAVLRRFQRNTGKALASAPGVELDVHVGPSHAVLANMADEHGASFDFIYLDGGHEAADVLSDLVLCYHLLKPGGVICCDDYLFQWNETDPRKVPKTAIDAFVNCFNGRVGVVMNAPLYQLFLRKNG